MKVTCVIVDDEPVARQGLEEYVSMLDNLQFVASCENVVKANAILTAQPVDLMYLDIHMPKVTGIEFLKALRHPPLTVLTTAYSEYALEGYALDVVDYLMKPITFERFLRATQKAVEILQLRNGNKLSAAGYISAPLSYFFVKCDNRYEKVFFDEVKFVEAMQNYVVIHKTDRKLISYLTLSGIEAQLPRDRFIKVHKSFVVSLNAIQSIDGNEVVVGTSRIPVSRNLKDEVLKRILGDRLFKR